MNEILLAHFLDQQIRYPIYASSKSIFLGILKNVLPNSFFIFIFYENESSMLVSDMYVRPISVIENINAHWIMLHVSNILPNHLSTTQNRRWGLRLDII